MGAQGAEPTSDFQCLHGRVTCALCDIIKDSGDTLASFLFLVGKFFGDDLDSTPRTVCV